MRHPDTVFSNIIYCQYQWFHIFPSLTNVIGIVRLCSHRVCEGKYKEACKPCHAENSPNGEYSPRTLIQDRWQRLYDENYAEAHAAVNDPQRDNPPVTEP